MGADHSRRVLTIDNEEDINVIKVSKSVVQRLTQKTSDTESGKEVRSSTLTESVVKKDVLPLPSQTGDIPVPSGYPVYYYPQLTLTALEIQQQKEQELLTQDQYWQKRLENLEKNHLKINRIIDEEYKKAVDELYVNSDKKQVNIHDTVQPCLETTDKVLKCYQDHPKEILKCSNLVEEFSNCVDQRRARLIAARC
ncbi:PREDICTED: MICOS complex subunit MIC25 isoform X1 [Dufourea novaeangliae]|uniref:Coiled-coil-helix-coiled-coil-helix domain-containing protein 6, mitochondrial n=1 Tax=Dufourea novaeangliae TaxID=178035 RepID=A0A154PBQ8_DUFNO|nr:PREDICTED: MICOS complex subunit MIC25 isoform X1 [Dufourea novaeangliae]KZC09339.1 Coiled-coil-helix-coiled-coil-helix domain-containing protein 6, mitochondrial [Dufourea novaeangliae]